MKRLDPYHELAPVLLRNVQQNFRRQPLRSWGRPLVVVLP